MFVDDQDLVKGCLENLSFCHFFTFWPKNYILRIFFNKYYENYNKIDIPTPSLLTTQFIINFMIFLQLIVLLEFQKVSHFYVYGNASEEGMTKFIQISPSTLLATFYFWFLYVCSLHTLKFDKPLWIPPFLIRKMYEWIQHQQL